MNAPPRRPIVAVFSVLCATVLVAVGASFGDEPGVLPPDAAVPVIHWKDARRFIDRTVIAQGRVVATKKLRTICFLNFDDPNNQSLAVIVRAEHFKAFPTPPETLYLDKIVRVRGLVGEYRGRPEIQVVSPEQITVLEKEEPIPPTPVRDRPPFDGNVRIATFNVLNLFDEYDDPYRADEGTKPKPRDQLENLAGTIRRLDADVLALQEVENRGYLERFVAAMLPELGYDHVVCFEGNDQRGIDCAVLSRLPVGPVTSFRHLRFSDGSGGRIGFQRDLLQVRIEPAGFEPFTVFVVHLKSKRGGEAATAGVRLAEAREIRRILDDRLSADAGARFVICGDFNDTWDSPALRTIRGDGPEALRSFHLERPTTQPTYNVRRYESMIDFILASPALAARYATDTFTVVPGGVNASGSDHNPVLAAFQLQRPEPSPSEQPARAQHAQEKR